MIQAFGKKNQESQKCHLWVHNGYEASLSYVQVYNNSSESFYDKSSHKVMDILFKRMTHLFYRPTMRLTRLA